MKKNSKPFLTLSKPWAGNENPIWLASTLVIRRNLKKYLFPAKLTAETKIQIRELITRQLKHAPDLSEPTFMITEEMGPLEKEFLFEHFLAPKSFQHAMGGEGFTYDTTGQFLGVLNVGDHLQLQVTDTHEDLEESWNRLIKLEAALGRTLDYAYTPRFGFLTADPMGCGTGTEVSLYLHLPALIQVNSLDETVNSLELGEVEARSIQGPLDEIVGDILVLRNRCSIGLSAEDILQSLRTQALKLIVAEKRIRQELRKMNHIDMKDRVSRAYGLLGHSYQLEIQEAWGGLSLLKLGLNLGWVTGTTQAELNELLFTTRRAHLISAFSEEIKQEELARKRAEYVHDHLRNVHLEI